MNVDGGWTKLDQHQFAVGIKLKKFKNVFMNVHEGENMWSGVWCWQKYGYTVNNIIKVLDRV